MVTTQNIVNRLAQLGYTVTTADEEQVSFELKKITNYVMNYCNITTIPEILDLRIIVRALVESFDREDVYIHCSCLHPNQR